MIFGIRLFQAFIRHILMDGTSTFQLGGHIDVLGKLLHKYFRTFPCILTLWWGMGRESVFKKFYDEEINLCVHNF